MSISVPKLHARFHYSDIIISMMASQNSSPLDCLLNCLFRSRSKKTSKLRVTLLCEGNPPVIGGFPSQRASNMENVSIWWSHHLMNSYICGWYYQLPWKEITVTGIFLSDLNCKWKVFDENGSVEIPNFYWGIYGQVVNILDTVAGGE